MVADFVGYDIGLCKVSRCVMSTLQFVNKTEIEISLLIGRTIDKVRFVYEPVPQAVATAWRNKTRRGSW